MSFLKNLANELISNGKMLIGYTLTQLPITDYPGVITAAQDALSNPSKENLIKLGVQGILAFGAGHRIIKILGAAASN